MYINGTWINTTDLLAYWRMSNGYEVKRGKRMQWTADRYSNVHKIGSIRAYKALDRILNHI